MLSPPPTLHILCGKIASGKSTLAGELMRDGGGVLIAEDAWLGALFGDEMASIADFARCSAKLRRIMGPHVAALLNAGLSVVLDFQANTVAARAWARGILDDTGAAHQLHFLDVPDDLCLARLAARNAKAEHPFAPTEAQFRQISRHFVAPGPQEGFTIIRHAAGAPDCGG